MPREDCVYEYVCVCGMCVCVVCVFVCVYTYTCFHTQPVDSSVVTKLE